MYQTYHAIKEAVAAEAHLGDDGSPLREIFTGGRSQNFRRAFLGVVIQCFQQITGINLITYYAVRIPSLLLLTPPFPPSVAVLPSRSCKAIYYYY